MLEWMLYALVVGAAMAAAAWVLERGFLALRLPTRLVWLAAMIGSVLIPILAWLRPAPESARGIPLPEAVLALAPLQVQLSSADAGARPDVLVLMWGAMSLTLLLYCGISAYRLHRTRRSWRSGTVSGQPVLISRDVGPAVLGWRRGSIVLPEWVLASEPAHLSMLVEHEREHLRARDGQLLLGGAVIPLLAPWHLPLWWQLRRMRLAVEVDCDRRVLRGGGSVRGYAVLLLEIGARTRTGAMPALAFARRETFLERRLRIMTDPAARAPKLRIALAGMAAALMVVLACEVKEPFGPGPADAVEAADEARAEKASDRGVGSDVGAADASQLEADAAQPADSAAVQRAPVKAPAASPPDPAREPVFTPYTRSPDLINRAETAANLEKFYPPLLKSAGIGGASLVMLYIDEAGKVQASRIKTSTGHLSLDEAALKVAETMQFAPAENHGKIVPVWVAIPIVFTAK